MPRALPFVLLSGLCGCITLGTGGSGSSGTGGDSNQSSDLVTIATYEVDAERSISSCGDGSLTLDPVWTFEVVLREDEEQTAIFWDASGTPKPGELLDDGEFSFTSAIVVDMRSSGTEDDWLPPCAIQRVDTMKGTFVDPVLRDRFKGTLGFHFVPTDGSDCSDLLEGDAKVLSLLPCDASYDIDAHATSEVRPMGAGGAGGAGGGDGAGGAGGAAQ